MLIKMFNNVGKGAWSLINIFYKGMGAIILLLIGIACPLLGIGIVCVLLYYIYKCRK